MKNWYCKPASKDEAIEIVERAVANGAVAEEVVYNMSMGAYEYHWNSFKYWGVFRGKTMTHEWGYSASKQLTIQQVREQFPFPNEVKAMSDKKEWQGMQDGLPPVGDWVMSPGGAKVFYVGTSSIGGHVFELDGGGLTVFDSVDGFSKIPNERDKWIEYVTGLVKPGAQTDESLAGEIYDAIKSGSLKAPEVG